MTGEMITETEEGFVCNGCPTQCHVNNEKPWNSAIVERSTCIQPELVIKMEELASDSSSALEEPIPATGDETVDYALRSFDQSARRYQRLRLR